jgi:hypothetical protein
MPTEAKFPGCSSCLRSFSMAGFELTLYGRIWVTPKAKCSHGRRSPLEWCRGRVPVNRPDRCRDNGRLAKRRLCRSNLNESPKHEESKTVA